MASCDNSTDEDVGQVMQRVWGALDRLAESDPEAYKKFIDQQMKEGREQMCQPEPVFCLQCDVTREGNQLCQLYLNVCKWSRVPRPQMDNDPVPVKGGALRHFTTTEHKKTKNLIFDVAFHPYVLDECAKEKSLEDMLISLSLDFVEDTTGLRVKRESCVKLKEAMMGVPMDIQCSLDEEWRGSLSKESRLDVGESLLSKLKEARIGERRQEGGTKLPSLKLPGNLQEYRPIPSDQKLIEDVSHDARSKPATPTASSAGKQKSPSGQDGSSAPAHIDTRSPGDHRGSASTQRGTGGPAKGTLKVPEYTMTIREKEGEGRRRRGVAVKVKLPGVSSVKQVDLEVSRDDLQLSVKGLYHLTLQLPAPVAEDLTKASFSTRTNTLSVHIPCT